MKIQTIKETVRGAQDTLARMAMHLYIDDIRSQARKLVEDSRRIAFLTGARRDYVWPGPSKSLGELCIELAEDTMRLVTTEYNTPPGFWGSWPGEISDLRRAMYGRHLPTPLDFGDGLTTPHNPSVCRDSECPIHGNPTWYVDQSRPRNEACLGEYHHPSGDSR